MGEVTLCVMSQKGFATLRAVIQDFGADFIDSVLTSRDTGLRHDWYTEIAATCRKNRVTCLDQSDWHPRIADSCVAVSWRWMIPARRPGKVIVFHDSLHPRFDHLDEIARRKRERV